MRTDIPVAHAKGKHGQYFRIDLISELGLVLLYQLRFKRASQISQGIELKGIRRCFERFADRTIFTIRPRINSQMLFKFSLESRFSQLLISGVRIPSLPVRLWPACKDLSACSKSKPDVMCHSYFFSYY